MAELLQDVYMVHIKRELQQKHSVMIGSKGRDDYQIFLFNTDPFSHQLEMNKISTMYIYSVLFYKKLEEEEARFIIDNKDKFRTDLDMKPESL